MLKSLAVSNLWRVSWRVLTRSHKLWHGLVTHHCVGLNGLTNWFSQLLKRRGLLTVNVPTDCREHGGEVESRATFWCNLYSRHWLFRWLIIIFSFLFWHFGTIFMIFLSFWQPCLRSGWNLHKHTHRSKLISNGDLQFPDFCFSL